MPGQRYGWNYIKSKLGSNLPRPSYWVIWRRNLGPWFCLESILVQGPEPQKLGSGHMWTLPWLCENWLSPYRLLFHPSLLTPVGREYSLRQMPISSMFSALCEDNLRPVAPKRKTNKQTNPKRYPLGLNREDDCRAVLILSMSHPEHHKQKENPQIQWVPWTLLIDAGPVGPTASAVQFLSEQQVQKEKEQTLKIACTHTHAEAYILEIYS